MKPPAPVPLLVRCVRSLGRPRASCTASGRAALERDRPLPGVGSPIRQTDPLTNQGLGLGRLPVKLKKISFGML
jgi:hypothetical protein